MARAPREEPEGLVYQPDLLTLEEESDVLGVLESLRFDPIVMHGQAARRTARHFGLDYDYEARSPMPGEPVPTGSCPFASTPPSWPAGTPTSSSRSSSSATRPARRSAGTATLRRSEPS